MTDGQIPGQLLFIINLIPNAHINPGPYWYLGMTLQLYIIYNILLSKRSDYFVFILVCICLILQLLCDPDGGVLYWMRRNFIGCFFPFAIGIIYARHQVNTNMKFTLVIIAILAVAVYFSNFNYYLWLIAPVLIVPLSIQVTKVCTNCKIIFAFFERIGKISSSIFIMHPIVHWILLPTEEKKEYIYAPISYF